MNLEDLRIRLNIFRVQTRQHSIPESGIKCFIEINGERYSIDRVKFEKEGNSFNIIMEG